MGSESFCRNLFGWQFVPFFEKNFTAPSQKRGEKEKFLISQHIFI
jgi:hypothetical protein